MKKNSFWWGVLGFFFPLVGLILFIIWNKDKKEDAKASLIGAISGFVTGVVISTTIVIIGFTYYNEKINHIEKVESTSSRIENTVEFSDKDQEKIINKLKKDEKVNTAKIDIKGKIIYITIDVTKDTSINYAKSFGYEVLLLIPRDVIEYYDLNFIISKNEEEGTTKEFPIMGYKTKKSNEISW